jgi:hypothetical protein
MTLSIDHVRELAVAQPDSAVLSVYVRTDPRDPANTAVTPGWVIELRNELRDTSRQSQHDSASGQRNDLRDLCVRTERDVLALDATERARGIAWFRTADGALDRRFVLQLPPPSTLVRLDERPFVSPLVDVVDRGRPAGLVLLSTDAVRLLHWQAGRVEEPQRPLYELELGEWRDYGAYVGHAGRSAGGMHVATFADRVEEWRDRFLSDAASATAKQVADLGWHRLVLVGEPRVVHAFASQLPANVRESVVATVEANLIWEEPAAVAERLGNTLDDAWRQESQRLVDDAIGAAAAGGAGAAGWADVLDCLIQHRAAHIVFAADSTPNPDRLPRQVMNALGDPPRDMLVERAVELAVGSGAEISAVSGVASLADAGGAVAALRY